MLITPLEDKDYLVLDRNLCMKDFWEKKKVREHEIVIFINTFLFCHIGLVFAQIKL